MVDLIVFGLISGDDNQLGFKPKKIKLMFEHTYSSTFRAFHWIKGDSHFLIQIPVLS